jgi:hypothetical protein
MSNSIPAGNVPSASAALRIAKQVKIEKQKQLEELIDTDIQKLKELARQQITESETDAQGYYVFKIKRSIIEFEDVDTVISQFCAHMEEKGFIVPKVIEQKSWLKNNTSYILRFRPGHELSEDDEDNDTTMSEGS